MEKQYKYIKIGGAWNGDYGISGQIELAKIPESISATSSDKYGPKVKFYLFENKKKEAGSKSPDYDIMVKNPEYNGATNPPKTQEDDGLPFR